MSGKSGVRRKAAAFLFSAQSDPFGLLLLLLLANCALLRARKEPRNQQQQPTSMTNATVFIVGVLGAHRGKRNKQQASAMRVAHLINTYVQLLLLFARKNLAARSHGALCARRASQQASQSASQQPAAIRKRRRGRGESWKDNLEPSASSSLAC